MYVELIVSATDITAQRKEEDGTDIGTVDTYSRDTYRLDVNHPDQYRIVEEQLAENPIPRAIYPVNRTILTTV